jgi:hypothetical protein
VPRSTQDCPHATRPPLHDAAQVPSSHSGVASAQVFPHPPQFVAFVARLTHAPAQTDDPSAHAQRPSMHTSDAAQTVPQAPQSRASLASSTQPPAHGVSPGLHDDAHVPTSQSGVSPVQATSHAPQWAGSDATGTHAPAHAASPARTQTTAASTSSPASPAEPGKSSVSLPQEIGRTSAVTAITIAVRVGTPVEEMSVRMGAREDILGFLRP